MPKKNIHEKTTYLDKYNNNTKYQDFIATKLDQKI